MSKKDYAVPMNQLTHSYRTKFDMSHTVKGSFKHGELIPFDIIEVLPGDTFKIDLASIIRMSTPIAPIMDNISMQIGVYFVPNRIVFDNWEQLMGVNKDGAWLTDEGTYVVPANYFDGLSAGCIGDYLGLPKGVSDSSTKVSSLPGRGLALIWNEYYRSPVVSAPLPVDHSASVNVLVDTATVNGVSHSKAFYADDCLPVCKFADYFTKCLPQPIKHDPIPFIADDLAVGIDKANALSTNTRYNLQLNPNNPGFSGGANNAIASDGTSVVAIKADVDATWNTIEALRTAFQLDRFYYKDMYARNYKEMLEAHFSVENRDSVLQIPQKIGEMRWRINIDQVLSTAGYAAGDTTTVGAPGANSVTTSKGSLTTFSATEHGYIFIVGCARHDHTYGQGFSKMWTRSDRLDFYDPVFANIGEQPVYKHELKATSDSDAVVFGYQEAWAEYRFIPDRVCGILNPSISGSLDFWTLSDNFATVPSLNEAFVYENRNAISRALVTGSTGPDYIFDMYFNVTAVREMPLFSIPGLADHN